jgi:hypothetical protein
VRLSKVVNGFRKLAPLEWWNYQESISDVKREDYSSDSSFELARQNTWEFPRFCFSMFRPSEESFSALLDAVNDYKGDVAWQIHDGCIGAFQPKPTFHGVFHSIREIEKYNESLRQPPDSIFIEKAVAGIPDFCTFLESRLGLTDSEVKEFDPRSLTKEGLAQSKGEFEDFLEPGTWTVFLARDPQMYAKTNGQPTSAADRSLSFGIGLSEWEELFGELGVNWAAVSSGSKKGPVIPDFPLLSRLSGTVSEAIYESNETAPFLAELLRAQKIVNGHRSIRGVDILIRIARWAVRSNLGIFFAGE